MSVPSVTGEPSARSVAAAVIQLVLSDNAYAAAALSHALDHHQLLARDRGLCTEIVYGTLRTMPYLLRSLGELGKIKQTDFVLVSHLLVAAYQIEFLDRVPAYAAVDEAVTGLTAARGKQVGGFSNAILRKLALRREKGRTNLRDAILQSTPSWLRKRLNRDVGEEEALALLAPVSSPRPYLRFVRSAQLPAWLHDECTEVLGAARVYRFDAGGDPRRHPEFLAGSFAVQEPGAALIGFALGARPGEQILDACAGRGQKTMILAEAVGESGQVVATDLHEHKVRALGEEIRRFGFSVETAQWDWTKAPPASWLGRFDRVLVDAPCSGVGTLRRRPEIVRRLSPESPSILAALQTQILSCASLALRPGGTLLFATCSVLNEEGAEVIERLLAGGQFEPSPFESEVNAALLKGNGEQLPGRVRLLPSTHDTDGYFLGLLKKSNAPQN